MVVYFRLRLQSKRRIRRAFTHGILRSCFFLLLFKAYTASKGLSQKKRGALGYGDVVLALDITARYEVAVALSVISVGAAGLTVIR